LIDKIIDNAFLYVCDISNEAYAGSLKGRAVTVYVSDEGNIKTIVFLVSINDAYFGSHAKYVFD